MNNVELTVLEIKNAEVLFNSEEIGRYLDGVLESYTGVVFNDDNVKECKATVTELNKMIKSVDAFRLKYKKEMLVPIDLFEKKCKDLAAKIEEVQSPLKLQAEEFEKKRKLERDNEVNVIIQECFDEVGLEDKWSSKFIKKAEWLNVSLSNAKLKKEVMTDLFTLKTLQTEYYAKKDLIDTKCELQSLKLGLNVQMIPDNFYYMIEAKTSTELENEIIKISELTKQRELEAIEAMERRAKEKADAEARETIRLSEIEKQKEIEIIKNETAETIQEISKAVETLIPVENLESTERKYKFTLQLNVTMTQKEALKNYLEAINAEYTVIK